VNRWSFLAVLAVVIGAVAAFAIYTWGWRDDSRKYDNERTRAEIAAQQVAQLCRNNGGGPCVPRGLERLATGLWRSRETDEEGNTFCLAIDLEHFRVASNGKTTHGVGLVRCPK